MKRFGVLIIAGVLLLGGCSAMGNDKSPEPVKAKEELSQLPPIGESKQMAFQRASNDLGLTLLKNAVADTPTENTLVSPLNITIALNMLTDGAEGETATELLEAMGLQGWSEADRQAAVQEIMGDVSLSNDLWRELVEAEREWRDKTSEEQDRILENAEAGDRVGGMDSLYPKGVMHIGNSLWVDDQATARQDYVDQLSGYYGGELFNLDLQGPKAKEQLDKWIKLKTMDMLKSAAEPGDRERMRIVSTLFFRGKWMEDFDERNTYEEPFHFTSGTTAEVDMMHATDHYAYIENADYQLLQIPYKQGRFVVLLPKEKPVDQVISTVEWKALRNDLRKSKRDKVKVTLPKFKLKTVRSLVEDLGALGVEKAFGIGADCSGISENPDDLAVSDILHQCAIEVDEEGTVAAAVTEVIMETTALVEPEEPIVFKADKPFLYFILDEAGENVLFAGVLQDPAEE